MAEHWQNGDQRIGRMQGPLELLLPAKEGYIVVMMRVGDVCMVRGGIHR